MSFKYPKTVRFKCLKCALCCGDTEYKVRTILLLKVEAKRISKKTVKSVNEFAERIEGFAPYFYRIKKTKNGKCIFLKDNLCTIYDVRPLICVFYPFELKEIRRNKYAFAYTCECPAIGKGSELAKSYFEKLFRKFRKTMKDENKNE